MGILVRARGGNKEEWMWWWSMVWGCRDNCCQLGVLRAPPRNTEAGKRHPACKPRPRRGMSLLQSHIPLVPPRLPLDPMACRRKGKRVS